MVPKTWREAHDIRQMAESIDARTFTALSHGIGLGELRPAVRSSARPAEQPRPTPRPQLQPMPRSASLVDKAEAAQMAPPAAPKGWRALERKLMAWSVDFLFVTTSLAMALSLATLVAALRTKGEFDWLELRPVAWLAAFDPLHILGAVYGIYIAYGLMFRLALGRTFGESMLGLGHKARTRRSPA